MQSLTNITDLLIEHDAFRACRLMSTTEFVRFCVDRKLSVDPERLRQFERLGVFWPLFRVYRPDVARKVESVPGGWLELGVLGEGEAWKGETRAEPADFEPMLHMVQNWREHGLLWDSRDQDAPHAATIDTEPARHVAYYSQFQIYALERVVSWMTFSVQLEWSIEADGLPLQSWGQDHQRHSVEYAGAAVKALSGPKGSDSVGLLCQLIANRYYFVTQGDERRITVTQFHDWNWDDYIRSWDPAPIVRAFSLTEDSLRSAYERLDIAWTHVDPIAGWYKLARFVSVEKRRRLKGDALNGLALREMAHMLRRLHKDAFGKDLVPLGEVGATVVKRIPDVEPVDDPLRSLELNANDFGVNAKPQLVLFVEGKTEMEVVPLMFERLFGVVPTVLGIEILNLGGVANAAGGKENPFSAVWRLVDYLHHHQTLAFVLLDNEGWAARNIAIGLPNAKSVYLPDRMATRADYVELWKLSFEFDNFDDAEIAYGLNVLSAPGLFSQSEIAACRASTAATTRDGKVLSLGALYSERINTKLDKPQLGRILAESMFKIEASQPYSERPIAQFLQKVAKAAARNHQPSTEERWQANQRSGHLGTLR